MTTKLPPKTDGVHRWVAIATYTLTAGQAAACHNSASVNLGPHNLVITHVGCIDCEQPWPNLNRCGTAAAPDMDSVTGPLTDNDNDRLLAATDLVGRTGGSSLEIGHLDDDVPSHLARWYATVTYRGAKVTVENFPGPVDAAEALAARLLSGGHCTRCGHTTHLEGFGLTTDTDLCLWSRKGDCWIPGCLNPDDIASYIAARRKPR